MAAIALLTSPAYGLARPAAVPSAYNDSFADGILRPWWTNPCVPGQTNAITFSPSGLMLFGAVASKHVFGIRQKAPPSSFTVKGLLASAAAGSSSDVRAGIYVAVAGSTGNVVGPFAQDGGFDAIGVGTVSDSADWSGYDGYQGSNLGGTLTNFNWFRIVWDAAGSSLSFAVSTDGGATWSAIGTRGSMSQPTEMGICIFANTGIVGPGSYGIQAKRFVVTTS